MIITSEEIEGTILRISPDVKSGNAYYYMTIDSKPNIIFNATSKVSTEIPLTNVGDKVKISFPKGEDGFLDIIEFDNLNIGNVDSNKEDKENSVDIKDNTDENTKQ